MGRGRTAGAVRYSASLLRRQKTVTNSDRACLDLGDLRRDSHLAEFAAALWLVSSCVEDAQI